MGMILRIASSRIVGQGDIVGRSGYFSLNLSANSVMRGRLDARRTLKSLVADLRVYTQVSQQLQMARAKVQEITPVYTVVQPATVPLKPAKPNKLMILIGFMFLAGVGSVGWILFVKDLLKGWKKQTI